MIKILNMVLLNKLYFNSKLMFGSDFKQNTKSKRQRYKK